jgi:hypothetical protein
MVAGDVPGQLRAGLSAGPVQSSGVVSAESSARSVGARAPHPGPGPRAVAVWVPANLGAAAREGWGVNRKRVRRLYRLDGLQVRMRMRR